MLASGGCGAVYHEGSCYSPFAVSMQPGGGYTAPALSSTGRKCPYHCNAKGGGLESLLDIDNPAVE
jgi:hypothetical protein